MSSKGQKKQTKDQDEKGQKGTKSGTKQQKDTTDGNQSSRRNSAAASSTSTSRRSSQQDRDRASQTGSSSPRRQSTQGSDSPRKNEDKPQKGRHNKIYHCPPTPPPEIIREKEKSFILDNIACSSISNDYCKTNPKLGPVVRPYNSQKDRHVQEYFQFIGVKRTLNRSEQVSI